MSFIASLSKVCSIFRSRIIPSTVNLNTPNPAIRWDEYRMRAPIEQTPLNPRHPSGKALISITSSGIGGSNGHAVLEGPPTLPVLDQVNDPVHFPVLFIAAGLSPRSATDIGDTLVELIPCHDPRALAGMSNIYGRRSRQMSWRSAAVYVPNQMPIKFPPPRFSPRKKRPVVFVFSGQGPQHFESKISR
jgi:acyl transferase domain-containing protein